MSLESDLLTQIINLMTTQVKGDNLILTGTSTITQPTMPTGTPINQRDPTYPLTLKGKCDRHNAVTFAVSGPGSTVYGGSSPLNGALTATSTSMIVQNPFNLFPTSGSFRVQIESETAEAIVTTPTITTLNGAINAAVTSLVVSSAAGFPAAGPFMIRIDSEYLLVTAVAGTTFTVTRAQNFSTAATHSNGAQVVLTVYSLIRGINGTVAASHANTTTVRQIYGVPSLDIVVLESDSNNGPFFPIPDMSGNSLGYAGVWQGLVDGQAIVANIGKPYYGVQVYDVSNILQGFAASLTNNLNASDTSFTIGWALSTSLLPAPGFVVFIDSEQMLVTSLSTVLQPPGFVTMTVQRGYNLSTAATHSAGAVIQQNYNPQGFRIIATPFLPSSRSDGDAFTQQSAFVNVPQSSNDLALVEPFASKRIRLLALVAQCGSTATTLTINTQIFGGVGTPLSATFALGANEQLTLPFLEDGWFDTNAGEVLSATTGAGSTIAIQLKYKAV